MNFIVLSCLNCLNFQFISVYSVDHVIEKILNSTSDKLEEARKILKRVMDRDLYYCVGQATVSNYVFMCLYYKSSIHTEWDPLTEKGREEAQNLSLECMQYYFQRVNFPCMY